MAPRRHLQAFLQCVMSTCIHAWARPRVCVHRLTVFLPDPSNTAARSPRQQGGGIGSGSPHVPSTRPRQPACGSHRHAHTASHPASQHGATSHCCSDPARAPRGPRAGQSETQGLAGAPPPQSRAFCLTCDVSHRPAHSPPWRWFKPQPCPAPSRRKK